jgi:hypothetical protein
MMQMFVGLQTKKDEEDLATNGRRKTQMRNELSGPRKARMNTNEIQMRY